ncbi:unnamed protein product, partial [Gulo gulo]
MLCRIWDLRIFERFPAEQMEHDLTPVNFVTRYSLGKRLSGTFVQEF